MTNRIHDWTDITLKRNTRQAESNFYGWSCWFRQIIYISKQLVPSDFNTINVDDTYEELLKSSGIGMKLANMSPDELKKSGELMGQARKTTDAKL
jgi:hypothetical protein